MAEVFISYSRADRETAKSLATLFDMIGHEVWWDHELYAGDDFHDVIMAELIKAKAVVVIWSPNSTRSRYVRDEASEALKYNKLIPTLAPGSTIDDVPLGFKSVHSIPTTDLHGINRAIEKLLAAAKVSLPEAKAVDTIPGDKPFTFDMYIRLFSKWPPGLDLAEYGSTIDPSRSLRMWSEIVGGRRSFGSVFNRDGNRLYPRTRKRWGNDKAFRSSVEAFLRDYNDYLRLLMRERRGLVVADLNTEYGRAYLFLTEMIGGDFYNFALAEQAN